MSKLSILQREKKRFFLFNKYYFKNIKYKKFFKHYNNFNYNDIGLFSDFQKIPRNSKSIRMRNRCYLTGRPRGVFRRFGLSRSSIKTLSFKGFLPGFLKAI